MGFRALGLGRMPQRLRNSCQLPYIGLLGIGLCFSCYGIFNCFPPTHTHITPCNMGSEDRRRKVHAAKRLANRSGSFRKCESADPHHKLTCHPTCPGPTPKPKPLNSAYDSTCSETSDPKPLSQATLPCLPRGPKP